MIFDFPMELPKKWKIYLLCKEDKVVYYEFLFILYNWLKVLITNKEFIKML